MMKQIQPLDSDLMSANRERLRSWQQSRWYAPQPEGYVKLHLGCGPIHLPQAINVDVSPDAPVCADIRTYPYELESVDDIICHHVLEHLPMRDIHPLIENMVLALKVGGVIELGVPDMDLMATAWLTEGEDLRWRRYAWTIYGGQSDEEPREPWLPQPAYNPHQHHQSAFTLGYLVRLLEDAGLRMIDAFWYDGHGTPSAFVFAQKPQTSQGTALERQTIIGTFTHRTQYLPALWASASRWLPQVQFATRINRGPINEGMNLLRRDFQRSGKRFWIFMDDDIQFLDDTIVEHTIQTMLKHGHAAVHAYSTFNQSVLDEPYAPARYPCVIEREARWATGYFIAVDSSKVGHIEPDMNLPDGNTSVDTSYSVAIRAAGHSIGMIPDYVYHTAKGDSWVNEQVIEPTNEYLRNKWGDFYFDVARYDNNVIEWQI